MKILIVDDNALMRDTLKSLVGSEATEFVECEDGINIDSVYRRFAPDWVLMDIQLKTSDGLTAAEEILKHDPAAHVIMVTNFDDSALRLRAHNAGAYGYVLKENLLELRALIKV